MVILTSPHPFFLTTMDMTLKFEPHNTGIAGGKSCNYVSKVGNEFYISCIPTHTAADLRLGITHEMAVFLIERGFLDNKKTFYYKGEPTEEQMSADALGVCNSITEYFEPNP